MTTKKTQLTVIMMAPSNYDHKGNINNINNKLQNKEK
jgi:hypothetical protein